MLSGALFIGISAFIRINRLYVIPHFVTLHALCDFLYFLNKLTNVKCTDEKQICVHCRSCDLGPIIVCSAMN